MSFDTNYQCVSWKSPWKNGCRKAVVKLNSSLLWWTWNIVLEQPSKCGWIAPANRAESVQSRGLPRKYDWKRNPIGLGYFFRRLSLLLFTLVKPGGPPREPLFHDLPCGTWKQMVFFFFFLNVCHNVCGPVISRRKRFEVGWMFIKLREGSRYQIRWIFGIIPNAFDPSPSFLENYIANFV